MPSLALNVRKKNIAPPCCPELDTAPRSDVLDFHYRQVYGTSESVGGNPVQVEVIVRTRLERITGAYSLGDLIYTNTLLPGEDVFLFTSDRRVRFAFDATTNITYRAENTLEDDFYMSSMGDFLADVTVKDEGKATNKTKGSLEGHADASSALQSAFGGSSVDMKGSFNAESTADFLNELTAHARASDHRSVTATHTASAISIGTVGTRQHAEGQAQDTFEASFRHFRNANRCHAVTYYFYRINKAQTVRFTIEGIDRRVIDPA
ncbi:MAG TPA: hypothetical protein VLF14_10965, partial [Candidatus Binatia bacterium]|nr:hypothetical protein [Candidatus Binatia bacterium]